MAASNWGLIMNIVNSIVGVSVLTMPFCFKQCGIILGTLLLILCSWMTHQSCMFLVKSASLSKRRTYAGLAFHAYGKAGKMLVETSMIGLMLGTCIAFYVVIGDLGSNFFARLFGLQVTGSFRVFLLITVSVCIVLPLSLQRNMMASIQSFSAMALIFYTIFMFVIVLSSFKHGLFSGQWLERVSYSRWEGLFRCIPIFGMSFACQSQVLPTYDSLDEPSVNIMSSIFASSLNVVTTFYVTVGFFGYVSFTDAIAGNVLMNFPFNLVTEMIRVGFMMSVAVGFPMMILPCRQALNTLLFEQQQKDGTFAAGGYMPPLRFKALTLTVVFGTMLGGILIPNVETILGLTGATMGSLICFICPALIYKKIHKNAFSAQMILGIGLGILVISTYSTLSVTEELPVKLEPVPEELEKAIVQLDPELVNIPAQNHVMEEVPEDGRDKEKEPDEKAEVEQPQIKVPIEVFAQPEELQERRKKEEEVQLDRPDQGIAQPVEKAHRHEPPIPHDQVLVDERQDKEDSEEKKMKPDEALQDTLVEAKAVDGKQGLHELDGGLHAPDKELGVDRPRESKHENENQAMLPKESREIDLKQQPAYKDLDLGPQAAPPDGQQAEKDSLGKKQAAADARAPDIRQPDKVPQPEKEIDTAENKDPLPVEKANGDLVQQPAIREARNVEENNPENPKEAGVGSDHLILDHAFLLQVIKEQQVQQKRLIDQHEKILAVIEEQHKEIHQQRQEEGDEKSGTEKPQEQAVAVKKEEEKAEEGRPVEEHNNFIKEESKQHPVMPVGQVEEAKEQVNDAKVKQLVVPNVNGNHANGGNAHDLNLKVNAEPLGKVPQQNLVIPAGVPDGGNVLLRGPNIDADTGGNNHPQPKNPPFILDGGKAQQKEANINEENGGKAQHEVPKKSFNKVEEQPPHKVSHTEVVHVPVAKHIDHAQPQDKLLDVVGLRASSKKADVRDGLEIQRKMQPIGDMRSLQKGQKLMNKEGAYREGTRDDTPIGHHQARKENGAPEASKVKSQLSQEHEVPGDDGQKKQDTLVKKVYIDSVEHKVNKQDSQMQNGSPNKNLDSKESKLEKAKSVEEIHAVEQKFVPDLQPLEPVENAAVDPANAENDHVKPNRELKLQNEVELRRRRRALPHSNEADEDEEDGTVVHLNPVPNVKVDDLRSALEVHLHEAAVGPLQMIHSRQLRQIPASEEEA